MRNKTVYIDIKDEDFLRILYKASVYYPTDIYGWLVKCTYFSMNYRTLAFSCQQQTPLEKLVTLGKVLPAKPPGSATAVYLERGPRVERFQIYPAYKSACYNQGV